MTKRKIGQGFPAWVALGLILMLCVAIAAYQALYPSADGAVVLEDHGATVDASNAGQGYIMVRHTPTQKRLKMRISKGDSTYTYDLPADEQYRTFVLPFGAGKYRVQVFKNISGKRYSNEASIAFRAEIDDDTLPFLYPNQYVNYTAESVAVRKSEELCAQASTDAEKLESVRAYVVGAIRYDYDLAANVQSGYLPDVDAVLAAGKGICFDYAALTACMLRAQGVPAKLEIGYADTIYHAWNSVLIGGKWQQVDTTAEANDMLVRKYTVERTY